MGGGGFEYQQFTGTVFRIYNLVALLILWLLLTFLGSHEPKSEEAQETTTEVQPGSASKSWLTIVAIGCLIITGVNYFINPHAFLTTNHFDDYFIYNGVRQSKLDRFEALAIAPDIYVFGSSKAHYISASYIEDQYHLGSFNMAVSGTTPLDNYSLLKIILDRKDFAPPKLIIYEVLRPNLSVAYITTTLDQVPYLYPQEIVKALYTILTDTVNAETLIDSLFVWTTYLHDSNELVSVFQFLDDGTRIGRWDNKGRLIDDELNEKRWPSIVNLDAELIGCIELDTRGEEYVKAFVKLAFENNIKILFYRSPYNFEGIDMDEAQTPGVKRCEKLFTQFMERLVSENNHVGYVDLFYDEYIPSLKWKAYYDRHHLTAYGSELLIDELAPEITKLLETN